MLSHTKCNNLKISLTKEKTQGEWNGKLGRPCKNMQKILVQSIPWSLFHVQLFGLLDDHLDWFI